MAIYDRAKRVLPPPIEMWQWGWTKSAEVWNGRIASKCWYCYHKHLCMQSRSIACWHAQLLAVRVETAAAVAWHWISMSGKLKCVCMADDLCGVQWWRSWCCCSWR